nr:glycosyl hydrolase [Bacteroidota bacterium]
LDDLTPFREFSTQVQQSFATLFPVKKAYRFQSKNGIHSERSFITGENPRYGASINYYIKDKIKDTAFILILDEKGKEIRKIKGTNEPGVNRVWWNLSYEELEMPSLRTRPRGKDWVPLDAVGKRAMYIYDLDIGPGLVPPLAPPGIYTVVLKISDKTFTQKLEVIKDPNTKGTIEDIQKQHDLAMNLYGKIKTCFQLIDEMETIRAKLLYMADSSSVSNSKKIKARKIENDLWLLEGKVHDIYQTGARQDVFRNPNQLLEQFLAISKEAVVSSADAPPTSQDYQVYDQLSERLGKVQKDYSTVRKSLTPLNKDIQMKSKVENLQNKN